MPAPPRSFSPTRFFLAASAMRSDSSMGSSWGLVISAPCARAYPEVRPARVRRSLRRYLDDDGLQVGHLLEREAASDSPDAALLAGPAAERQVRLPVVGRLVHVHPPCFQRVGKAERAREVPGVHGAEQAVGRVVRQRERLLLVPELNDRRDRAERLLAADPHVGLHAVEDRRVVVEAGRKTLRALAAE